MGVLGGGGGNGGFGGAYGGITAGMGERARTGGGAGADTCKVPRT